MTRKELSTRGVCSGIADFNCYESRSGGAGLLGSGRGNDGISARQRSLGSESSDPLIRACYEAINQASEAIRASGSWSRVAQAAAVCDIVKLMYGPDMQPGPKPAVPRLDDTGLAALQFFFNVHQWYLATQAPASPVGANETNLAVRRYLLDHSSATQRQVAVAIGASISAVGRTTAWKAVAETRRRLLGAPLPKAVSFVDNAHQLDERDAQLHQLIEEQRQDDRRHRVHARQRV